MAPQVPTNWRGGTQACLLNKKKVGLSKISITYWLLKADDRELLSRQACVPPRQLVGTWGAMCRILHATIGQNDTVFI